METRLQEAHRGVVHRLRLVPLVTHLARVVRVARVLNAREHAREVAALADVDEERAVVPHEGVAPRERHVADAQLDLARVAALQQKGGLLRRTAAKGVVLRREGHVADAQLDLAGVAALQRKGLRYNERM